MRLFREVSSASAAAESLSLGRQEKVTKEKATRRSHPAAPGSRRAGGVSRRHVPVPTRTSRADPPARRRDLRGGRSRARIKSARAVALGSPVPSMVPSSAVGLGGKARMFERMDARVRAGPSPASSAGNRAQRGTSVGCPSLWFLSLGEQEKVTRPPSRRTKPRDKSTSSEKSLELDASSAAGRPVLSLSKGWHDEQANHEQEIHEQAIHEQASNPREGLPPPRQARPPPHSSSRCFCQNSIDAAPK